MSVNTRIFIADDDRLTQRVAEKILTRLGYDVVGMSTTGEETVTKVLQLRPDLVLMDVFMDGKIDGIETTKRIKEELDVPVVFISANGTGMTFKRAKETKPYGFISKPIKEKELFAVIELALYNNLLRREKDRKSGELQARIIREETNDKVFDFISRFVDIYSNKTLVESTTSHFSIKKLLENEYLSLVNLERVNDIRFINKFFEAINSKLPEQGVFIGCFESKDLRKRRIFKKYPIILNFIYYCFDFVFKRIFPKVFILKNFYFLFTGGRNRVLSKAEVLGRLYSCGFKVNHTESIKGRFYFVAEKKQKPCYDQRPSYGPIFRMKRVGKNGKTINVYKFRTMYPFSEFLQEYIYEHNKLQEGGKIKNDFRVTTLGKFFRKFWLDELPMIWNLLRGDLKLVGVRPITKHYMSLYSDEHQQYRLKFKPGLVPPFYADLPKTIEEIMESEKRYLESYEKHPFRTDFRYFFKIWYNIIFKKARSR